LNEKLKADSGLWDEVNKLTVENNHFASKIRDLILHIDSQNEKEEKLNKDLIQRSAQVKSLQGEKEKLNAELEKLTQQKLFSGGEQEKIKEENAFRSEKLELLENQLSEAKFLISSQNISLGNTEQFLLKLRSEYEETLDELFREKALIINDNAMLVADHDLVHYDNELLKGEIQLLKISMDELSVNQFQEKEAFRNEKKDLDVEMTKLKTEIETISGTGRNSADLEKQIEGLNLEIENLNESLQHSIAESRQKIDRLDHEKNNLIIEIENLNRQVLEKEEAKPIVSEQENEAFIDKLFKQIDALNDEKQVLSGEKDEMEEQVGILQLKLVDLSQVIESQTGEIKNLEDRNKQVKLAQALVVSSKDKTATKLKINELVREIDKCIALLSV
jgi:chromosome segregation ATPase